MKMNRLSLWAVALSSIHENAVSFKTLAAEQILFHYSASPPCAAAAAAMPLLLALVTLASSDSSSADATRERAGPLVAQL